MSEQHFTIELLWLLLLLPLNCKPEARQTGLGYDVLQAVRDGAAEWGSALAGSDPCTPLPRAPFNVRVRVPPNRIRQRSPKPAGGCKSNVGPRSFAASCPPSARSRAFPSTGCGHGAKTIAASTANMPALLHYRQPPDRPRRPSLLDLPTPAATTAAAVPPAANPR